MLHDKVGRLVVSVEQTGPCERIDLGAKGAGDVVLLANAEACMDRELGDGLTLDPIEHERLGGAAAVEHAAARHCDARGSEQLGAAPLAGQARSPDGARGAQAGRREGQALDDDQLAIRIDPARHGGTRIAFQERGSGAPCVALDPFGKRAAGVVNLAEHAETHGGSYRRLRARTPGDRLCAHGGRTRC